MIRREKKGRIGFNFECCQTQPKDLRLKLVKALKARGFIFTSKAEDFDATYSRFWLRDWRRQIDEPKTPDAVRQLINSLLEERKNGFELLERVCKEVFGHGR